MSIILSHSSYAPSRSLKGIILLYAASFTSTSMRSNAFCTSDTMRSIWSGRVTSH